MPDFRKSLQQTHFQSLKMVEKGLKLGFLLFQGPQKRLNSSFCGDLRPVLTTDLISAIKGFLNHTGKLGESKGKGCYSLFLIFSIF